MEENAARQAQEQRARAEAAQRAAQAAEEAQRAAALRREQEIRDQRDREQRAAAAEAERAQRRQRAARDCDMLAANPTDARRAAGSGAPFDELRQQAAQAFDACSLAAEAFPDELRFQYQLARAAQFRDKKTAFALLTALTAAKYAAAFDNLGGMYIDRKEVRRAIALFQTGASLGDVDAMVSLAELAALLRAAEPRRRQMAAPESGGAAGASRRAARRRGAAPDGGAGGARAGRSGRSGARRGLCSERSCAA